MKASVKMLKFVLMTSAVVNKTNITEVQKNSSIAKEDKAF